MAALAVLTVGLVMMPNAVAFPGNGGGHHRPPGGGGSHLTPFAGCGTMVEGVECTLFQADAGGLYILGTSSPVGSRLYVQGQVDSSCVSYCQQGNGCIVNATISTCATGVGQAIVPDGMGHPGEHPRAPFSVQDLVSVIDAWGPCAEGGSCQWDLDDSGKVDAGDIVTLVKGLE
jgi:hypothetical protein